MRYRRTLPDRFVRHCDRVGAGRYPAHDVVADFLRDLVRTGRTRTTVDNYRKAIGRAYRDAGLASPADDRAVRAVVSAPPCPNDGYVTEAAAFAMLAILDPSVPLDARSAAQVALFYVHGEKLEDVLALRVRDVRLVDGGVRIRGVFVADRPDRAALSPLLRVWLVHLGRRSGPLFPAWSTKGRWKDGRASIYGVYHELRRVATVAGAVQPSAGGPTPGAKRIPLKSVAALNRRWS